jgi:hypothetical protein
MWSLPELLARLPARECFLVLGLTRHQCRGAWCIALSLLRFAPGTTRRYPYLPRPWPSWWRCRGHPHMGMVRLGQPASASRVSRLPLWSARQPAGTDRWLYASPERGCWRAGYLFDPKISVVDPSTRLECAAAFFTYAMPDDRQGLLDYRTVLVRLTRCFRLLDDAGARPGGQHSFPPTRMLPQQFRRPASDTPLAWHFNPETGWCPGYVFETRQVVVLRDELVKISYFVYFKRPGHGRDFYHSIWRVRTARCRRGFTSPTLDYLHEHPLHQLVGLPGRTPARADLDWDARHLRRERAGCPPHGGPPRPQ